MQTDLVFAVVVRGYHAQQQNSEQKTIDHFDALSLDEPVARLEINEPAADLVRTEPSVALRSDPALVVAISEQHEAICLDIADHDEPVRVIIPDLNDHVTVNIPDLDESISVKVVEQDERVEVVIADQQDPVEVHIEDSELVMVDHSLVEIQQKQVSYQVQPIADVQIALITEQTHERKTTQTIKRSMRFRH